MKTSRAKEATRLENRVTPEQLDLFLDNWLSQPEGGIPSSSMSTSSINTSLDSHENIPPKASTQTPTKSLFDKRWKIFRTKKQALDALMRPDIIPVNSEPRRNLIRKKSKLFKKKTIRTKSTPNLKGPILSPVDLGKVNAHYAPAPDLPPILHISPPQPGAACPTSNDVSQTPDSVIYFTVDPNWDHSTGEAADVYLLPFPDAQLYHPQHGVEDLGRRVPRQRAITHVHVAERVQKANNETSFLILS